MKKIGFIVAVATMLCLGSCNKAPKASFQSDLDSLAYMMGVANTMGLDDFIKMQLNVDSTNMSDFIAGLKAGAQETSEKKSAYLAGMQIGQQVSKQIYNMVNDQVFEGDSINKLNKDNFVAGFISAVEKKALCKPEVAQAYIQHNMDSIKNSFMTEKYAKDIEKNVKFLEENKAKEGVKVTESGLQYKVITEGKGAVPQATDRVKVNYKGTLIDGTEFDSSYGRKDPATFRVDGVIKGWSEALTMMPVGSKWELYIPQELAYGNRKAGKIPPFSTLVFEVELLSIEKK